jgi:hypothetical protein
MWVGGLCERDFASSEGVSVAIVEYQGIGPLLSYVAGRSG